MMTSQEMIDDYIAFARSMIGVKWRHRGRKPWAVDCLGLIVLSLTHAGIEVQDREHYGRDPWKEGLRQALVDHFGEPVTDWKKGDIALIKWEGMREPSHVALIADYAHGGLSLIHAYSTQAVIEHIIDSKWKSNIIEVFRPCK